LPVYRSGKCPFCNKESDKLRIITGISGTGLPIVSYACPDCRHAFDEMREEDDGK